MAEELFLAKDKVGDLIKLFQNEFTVIAPVARNGEVIFRQLKKYEEVCLDLEYKLSILPPQKVFPFCIRQKMFKFSLDNENAQKNQNRHEKVVLFGLHITDLLALVRLDKIMTHPYRDDLYWEQRESMIIVGLDYPAHPLAFQPPEELLEESFDLFLDDVGEEYRILVGSSKGGEIVSKIPLLRPHSRIEKEPPVQDQILKDSEKIREAVEKSYDSPLWDEMAQKCIGCGICTWVCPLCYCFDVCDKVHLSGEGEREKIWDSCLLKDFAAVAGGKNFRTSLRERFYNWYHHKFVRMPKEYGFLGCTGCGRCSFFCPVGINVKQNLIRLITELEREKNGQ